jgi:ABC-type transport system involved in multi-copper enzyme maturation permease subunit
MLITLFTCTAAVAIWLVISGLIVSHGWTTFTSHHCASNDPGSSEVCLASFSTSERFGSLNVALCGLLPAILGLVLGVPLVAGELEQRTHRLAWTQSITKTRWLLSKVGVGVLVVTGVIGAMAPLVWWSTDAAQRSSHIQPSNFDITGIVSVSYGVFAFMLGVTLGALIRHTGWAFAACVALYALVRLGVRLYVRPNLISPTTTSVATPINSSYWYVNSSSTQFQPPNHFWPLQMAESAIFLGFALALLGFGVLAVKRWRI